MSVRGEWIDIDIWPKGRSGFDARYRIDCDDLYCYCKGTDHLIDWLHRFAPWAGRRERQGAEMILKRLLPHIPGKAVKIAGFSLGGAVGVELALLIAGEVRLTIAGSKRPRWRDKLKKLDYIAYKHRGHIVPWLPPWRPRIKRMVKIGRWTPLFWRRTSSGLRALACSRETG